LHKPEDILLFQVFCGGKFTPSVPNGLRTRDIGLDKYDGYFSHPFEFPSIGDVRRTQPENQKNINDYYNVARLHQGIE
jgi:hypothetical protein